MILCLLSPFSAWCGATPSGGLLQGKLEGDLELWAQDRLHWSLQATQGEHTAGQSTLQLTAPGLQIQVNLTLDPQTGDGTWSITDSQADLSVLLKTWLPRLAPAWADLTAQGRLQLSGEGTLRGQQPAGAIQLAFTDGTVAHALQGWKLTGVNLLCTLDAAQLATGPLQLKLDIGDIATSRFGARALSATGTLADWKKLTVTSCAVEIAGGHLRTDPFSVDLAAPALDVPLHVRGIGLQDVAALVPTGLADVVGRVDGDMSLRWNPKGGVEIGAGSLRVSNDEPTLFRLLKQPGFLTASIPKRLVFMQLPKWTGPLSNLLAPINPAYKSIQDIELGLQQLRVESMSVALTPKGDGQGRSAQITIVARPNLKAPSDSAIAKVTFTINVAGPLTDLLILGMQQPFSFGN